ncbi:zinc dependent phospholipase C family protein [Hymenobacter sp. H14-R3]|uniref:zinc dependent phospholipase C family protein n=1 Tax=Hymenobacter sp. H14-R3 TaxID=3046308 RepID=UPI0024BADEC5|nr:zinc dependent phospholipase C family protein [Hymenobacter sp. H14-R3]MDJ0363813.1 zinc dependent phospholipase C family protein [Hymenobacter sp. H14-R3]
MKKQLLLLLLLAGWPGAPARAWGFFGHRLLNRLAVYTLPPEMLPFFKGNIEYLTANATRPDSRRTVVPTEAPRHFMDVDVYGDSALTAHGLPRAYADAVALAGGEDSLLRHGIVPWQVASMKSQLTAAFQAGDTDRILYLAADLGHYVADACVPLHTTRNYNGQLTGQRGIHALWESRLPELQAADYDLLTGQAPYLEQPIEAAWAAVARAHAAVDSVFRMESAVSAELAEDRKYGYEQRGNQTIRTYSREFSQAYHRRLNGQVERQLRYAARLIGAFWYTSWVDAGQPDLGKLPQQPSGAARLQVAAEAKAALAAPEVPLPGHDE